MSLPTHIGAALINEEEPMTGSLPGASGNKKAETGKELGALTAAGRPVWLKVGQ